jgi:hypothetical protein
MCEHCDVLTDILIQLFGGEVAKMIMEVVRTRVHSTSPPFIAESAFPLVTAVVDDD